MAANSGDDSKTFKLCLSQRLLLRCNNEKRCEREMNDIKMGLPPANASEEVCAKWLKVCNARVDTLELEPLTFVSLD